MRHAEPIICSLLLGKSTYNNRREQPITSLVFVSLFCFCRLQICLCSWRLVSCSWPILSSSWQMCPRYPKPEPRGLEFSCWDWKYRICQMSYIEKHTANAFELCHDSKRTLTLGSGGWKPFTQIFLLYLTFVYLYWTNQLLLFDFG